ncbi:MAG: GC-type dockerin domain-anchored protein [Phycisphaerales bacterium]
MTIQFDAVTCGPVTGAGYQVVAHVSNLQPTAANNTVATIVMPPTFSYTSADTGGVGSVSYNAATRTLTWNAGTFGASAAATLTINGTAVAAGGLTFTGSVSSTSANEPTGNNTAIAYNEVQATGAALGVIAVGSFSDPLATSVYESVDGFSIERKLGTIYRPFTSQNGQWIVFRTDLAGLAGDVNGAVIVGHNTGSGWTFDLVAREGYTAPIAGHSTWIIDASTFGNVLGINNSGEYVYSGRVRDNMGTPTDNTDDVLHWFVAKGTVAGGVSMTIKGANTGPGGGTADADAPGAPELAGKFYNVLSSSTIQNDGTVSFATTLTPGSTGNAAFLKNSGNTLLAQKDITTPTGSAFPWSFMDSDASSDGNGLLVSADGSSWLGTGRVGTGDTTTDNVVVVNGAVVVQEGSPITGFTDGVTWGTFGSQQLPWGQMMPDGHWFLQGFNGATTGFNSGQDWVMRDGVVIARTGGETFAGSNETWADNVLQRTFAVKTGAGDKFVVGGLTNRSTAANGSDDATDGVIVYNNQLLVREGAPVQMAEGDVRYFNNFNDDRSFIAGNNLYATATIRPANATCTRNFSNLAQAIVVVPLPGVTPACPADLGVQGGLPGQDGVLDNNDFIAFISFFFNHDSHADLGIQGGLPGHDGAYDNNDFIAFINFFFAGCPH